MGSQGAADEFRFPTEIKTVAVIGAGISGVASAAHLLRQGLDVTVFERSTVAGGVWHYDPTVPAEPPYPNDRPHAPVPDGIRRADSSSSSSSSGGSTTFEEAQLAHAPPGPCYNGLRNNIPTSVMRTTLMPWPEGTPDYITHGQVETYIQELAARTGVQDRIRYGARVESVRKEEEKKDPYRDGGGGGPVTVAPRWTVRTRTLQGDAAGDRYRFVDDEWEFDAVVVASGRYHEPRIPDLPGLKEWKARFPDGVLHSKAYRSPEPFRGRTVLLVGGGVSALDIGREIVGIAKETYQSVRGGKFDLPAGLFASGVKRVGQIDRFVLGEDDDEGEGEGEGGGGGGGEEGKKGNGVGGPREGGSAVLRDGRVIRGIDAVILCTGYITTYPFLGPLQAPAVPKEEADDRVVITSDGCTTHNLHKDVFYIPDPSLAFVGVPYHASAFSLFDFQAEVVARVFAGKALLPSQRAMRSEYDERKPAIASGGGAAFHSLMKRDVEYMRGIQEWVNRDAARLGHEPMDAIDEKWVESYFSFLEDMKGKRWEDPDKDQEIPQPVGKELRGDLGDLRVVSAVSG
ncbi:hypothetical protein VTG60DRAFT_2748 [Thermothelomyces hinnuleus]